MVDRSCNRNTLLETARAEQADKSDMLLAALEVAVSGIRNRNRRESLSVD